MSLAIQPAAAAIDSSQIFGVRANGRVRQKVSADVLFPGDPDKLELQIAIELRLTGGGQAEGGEQLQVQVLGPTGS